eukprot:6890800-Heterocapsa_arctica.AAC.1
MEGLLASPGLDIMSRLKRLQSVVSTNPPTWLSEDQVSKGWHKWLSCVLGVFLRDKPRFEPILPDEFHLELAQLAQELELAQRSDRNLRAKQWSSWAKTSLEGSTGKAHKFARQPSEWRPSVDTSEEGAPSASPKTLLDGQKQ